MTTPLFGAEPLGRRVYWVDRGRLMAGPYPGNVDPAQLAANIEAMHAAGIRHLVNLMEDDETDHHGRPFVPYEGVAGALGMTTRRFATVDMTPPSTELMTRVLDDIDAAVTADRPVYVHCWGGRGRTGTVVGCWLVRHRMAGPGAALDRIIDLRRDSLDAGEASPQTPDQRARVRDWRPGC